MKKAQMSLKDLPIRKISRLTNGIAALIADGTSIVNQALTRIAHYRYHGSANALMNRNASKMRRECSVFV
jgi:hypothetical protein